MKVTQEKLPSSQIGLKIEISPEISKQTYEKVVQNLSRTANIPGFRKGKVPRQILLQRMGIERVKAAAVEDVLQSSVDAAIKQEDIKAIGNYQIEPSFEELVKNYQPEQPLSFRIAVDVPPTVVLSQYRNLAIKAEEVFFDENQVENYLAAKQTELATLVPVEDRSAQANDTVIVDYEAFKLDANGLKGDSIEELKGVDSKIELTEGKLLAGMLEGLLDMSSGEVKDINVTFPADYPRPELAGNAVIFVFNLKEIKTSELPDLDDEFAKEISDKETIEELKLSLEEDFKKKAEEDTTEKIHLAILEQLTKNTEIELPETYIEQEIKNILTQTAMQMEQYGLDVNTLFREENLPKLKDNARPDAIQKIKEKLIIEEITKTEGITVDKDALDKRVEEVKKELDGRPYDNDRLIGFIQEELSNRKTLDWLRENSQVELVAPSSEPATVDVEATEVSEETTEA